MNTKRLFSFSVTLTAAVASSSNCSFAQGKECKQESNKKQNILYIIVDDLRTELNCYGVNNVVSPNIDTLAAQGTLFSRAYCNIPVSGASRASIMTGTRPTRNTFSDFDAVAEVEKPETTTLNDYFKSQGYTTIALGFLRPHLPFIAPQKYWDMYDYNQITVPDNYVMPSNHGIPATAFHNWGELRKYTGIPESGALPIDSARVLIHGYRASVSFVDAQIGRVMAKLKALGLDQNTAIVLVGDHGWNLGEHGIWCKHTIFETSLHAPLIIADPAAKVKGGKSDQVVEFVDIYPTICDMSRLAKPAHLEGESLLPLLNSRTAKSKGYAVSRWNQGFTLVTTDHLFYTEWWDASDKVINRLLFDHRIDAQENKNLVDGSRYTSRLKELSAQLKTKRGVNFDKYPSVTSTKN